MATHPIDGRSLGMWAIGPSYGARAAIEFARLLESSTRGFPHLPEYAKQ